MSFKVSDELLRIFVPILLYWVYVGVLQFAESRFSKFKILIMKESNDKNLVSRPTVVVVLLQQFGQATIAGLLFLLIGPTTRACTCCGPPESAHGAVPRRVQFFFAMLVLDTLQYFMHARKQGALQVHTPAIIGWWRHMHMEQCTTTPSRSCWWTP
ncbi:hypothetical protein ACFX2I_026093 [Malus domestica]